VYIADDVVVHEYLLLGLVWVAKSSYF